MLQTGHIDRLKAELVDVSMRPKPYNQYQTTAVEQPQWTSHAVAELIGHPPMIEFLKALMGPEIIFTRGFFQRTHFIYAVSRITLGAMNITQDQIKELDGLYAVSNLML